MPQKENTHMNRVAARIYHSSYNYGSVQNGCISNSTVAFQTQWFDTPLNLALFLAGVALGGGLPLDSCSDIFHFHDY